MTKLFVLIQNLFASLRDEERGATAVEYGLIVALIAAFCIGAIQLLGQDVDATFDKVTAAIP